MAMTEIEGLHDSRIFGITNTPQNNADILVTLTDGTVSKITLSGIQNLTMNNYAIDGNGNIVLCVEVYSGQGVSPIMVSSALGLDASPESTAETLLKIEQGDAILIHILPTTGAELYCICSSVSHTPQQSAEATTIRK